MHQSAIMYYSRYLSIVQCQSHDKRCLVSNGQHSPWINVEAGFPQGSILWQLFFLIYINPLSDNLTSNTELVADNISLFSIVRNINSATNNLNSDLMKVSDWAYPLKMRFNSDLKKHRLKRWFSVEELTKFINLVKLSSIHKCVGLVLYTKLDFYSDLQNMQNKVNKTIGLLSKLQNMLPRASLITIYKSLLKPHLDYEESIYDQAYNTSSHQNIESIHYNAAAVWGTSREELYQESDFESLQRRRCYRKRCLSKRIKKHSPNTRYFAKESENISQLLKELDFFKNLLFPLYYLRAEKSETRNQKI